MESAHNFEVSDLFSVKGKTILVTGGSSGLGLQMAAGFLQNGARVIIASRKQANCDTALDSLSNLGEAYAVAADVASADGRARIVEFVTEKFGKLDVLVNNAGTNYAAQIEDYSDEAFEKVINTNVSAVFSLTRDLTPLLSKAGTTESTARVINIGSMDGIHVPVVQRIPTFAYSASKASLHHLTKTLAIHLASRHIVVNAVAPGFFASKMTDYVFDHYLEDIEADCPLKRVGQPNEIVGIAIYLASAAGAYTNGTVIPVDGGCSISKGYREWLD